MKKMKHLFILALCCLMLYQTSIDFISPENIIELHNHYDEEFFD